MKIKFEVDGVKELNTQIKRTQFLATRECRQATLEEAQAIMNESLEQVPRRSGTLASSAFVEQNAQGMVDIGYGKDGVAEEYMVAVHERLDVFHPQGKAKFLEDPVNAHALTMKETVAKRILAILGGK